MFYTTYTMLYTTHTMFYTTYTMFYTTHTMFYTSALRVLAADMLLVGCLYCVGYCVGAVPRDCYVIAM